MEKFQLEELKPLEKISVTEAEKKAIKEGIEYWIAESTGMCDRLHRCGLCGSRGTNCLDCLFTEFFGGDCHDSGWSDWNIVIRSSGGRPNIEALEAANIIAEHLMLLDEYTEQQKG